MMWHSAAAGLLLALTLPAVAAPAQALAGQERIAPATRDTRDPDAERERVRRSTPAPGDTIAARPVKTGWWWAANEPPPQTGLLAAPQAPTPTTPKGAVPVGAVAGEPERISAIEVKLRAAPGSTVTSFEMVLRESAEPGANAGADAATIVACPVTDVFWADGAAAAWKNRPGFDCALGEAEGKRNAKGLWRFDLTQFAATWLTEGNSDSRSVVLVEKVEAPEGFQVAFDGLKAEGIGLELRAKPPADMPDDLDAVDAPSSGGLAGSGTGGGFSGAASSGGSSFGGTASAPALGSAGADPLGSGPAGDTPPSDTSQQPGDAGRLEAVPVAAAAPWHSGLPKAGFVLLPLVLALAYLMMLALGPDARPATTTGRRGVSRALDRLRMAGRTPEVTR